MEVPIYSVFKVQLRKKMEYPYYNSFLLLWIKKIWKLWFWELPWRPVYWSQQATTFSGCTRLNIQVFLDAQITGDSQLLPDSSQFSLRVCQLNCKVLLVFIRKWVGWVWWGIWTWSFQRTWWLLRLEIISLLSEIYNDLEIQRSTECQE